MDKVVIIKYMDGSCGVLFPAAEMFDPESHTRALLPGLIDASEDDILQYIILKDVPTGLEYRIATKEDLPSDKYFRNAWVDNADSVDINMDKARDIQMENIRAVRDEKLRALDVDALRAISSGRTDEAMEIESQKQVLRDIPGNFDLTVFSTPEELKQAMPEELISA